MIRTPHRGRTSPANGLAGEGRARPPATPIGAATAGGSRSRPSPRCRRRGDGSVGDGVARRGPGRGTSASGTSRDAPGSIWSRIQHRGRVGLDRDGAVPRVARCESVIVGPAVTRRAPDTAGVRSPDSAALTRRLTSSARTSESPASTASRTSAGDVVGRRLRHVRAGGHVGVHEADVDARPPGCAGRAAPGAASWSATTTPPSPRSTGRSAGRANHDSTDRTLTIAPPPLAASTGANARLIASGPSTLVSNSRWHLVHRVAGQHRRAGADPGVVDRAA